MATKGAIELAKLKEDQRHNLAMENVEQGKLDETIAKRGTDRMLGLGTIAAKMMTGVGKNDLSWYTYFFDMIMSQLKQSIDCYAGFTIPIDRRSVQILETNYDPIKGYDYKQNIVSFEFMPTIGADDNYGTTTAEASKNFNTKVRGSNSGSTNYDAIDLFKYPLAVDSPSYMLQWLYRGMCLCNYKDVRDPSSTNYGLLLAHCYNDVNIMRCFLQRRAAMVDLYNDIILSLNVMNIPFNMPYILRHNWLCSTVFTNREGVGKQYFIVNPVAYFIYNESTGSLHAISAYKKITAFGNTPDDILWGIREMFHTMLVPLTNSQAIGTMTGDINKAFGEGVKYPMLSLDSLTNMCVAFISDIKYLQSFKNADIVPIKPAQANTGEFAEFTIHEGIDANLDPFLYQGNYVGYNWTGPDLEDAEMQVQVSINGSVTADKHVFIKDNPAYVDYYDDSQITEEDQIYNLSFKNTYDVGINYWRLHASRSEILVTCTIFQYNESTRVPMVVLNTHTNVLLTDFDYPSVKDFISSEAANLLRRLAFQQFDFLPRFYIVWPNGEDNENIVQLIWNRNVNRNTVDRDLITKIQRSALLSMFMPSSNTAGSTSSTDDKNKTKRNNKGKGKNKNKKKEDKGSKPNPKDTKKGKDDTPSK